MIVRESARRLAGLGGSEPNPQARANRLLSGKIWTHPFVIGEIALGQLHQHRVVLQALRRLPHTLVATDEEALHFIDSNPLFGVGIGYVDVHLIAALRLTPGTRLWTNDKRLDAVAADLCLALAAN